MMEAGTLPGSDVSAHQKMKGVYAALCVKHIRIIQNIYYG